MAYALGGSEWLLTGDHIMGWNSTLVAVPDGSMRDYLASLEKVLALPYRHYVPAHGGPIADGPAYARSLLAHRKLRNKQVVDAVGKGARRIDELLVRIYPQLKGALRMAAGMTLKAHIEYLEEQNAIRVRRTLLGLRLAPA
jgi:glyoxylase-like metal-dependent hydrolase (beta-lactamase superfamily II)